MSQVLQWPVGTVANSWSRPSSFGDCRTRAAQLGFTPLPKLPYKQEYWRLDTLLHWSHGNGLEFLPTLGLSIVPRRK
jgi:hypothetical protein